MITARIAAAAMNHHSWDCMNATAGDGSKLPGCVATCGVPIFTHRPERRNHLAHALGDRIRQRTHGAVGLDGDPVELERLHRARASTEDRIRVAKQTGLANLPFHGFEHNAVSLEIALIAQDLTAWTQTLALERELATCEPKTLRYRLLHAAGRLAFHARRAHST